MNLQIKINANYLPVSSTTGKEVYELEVFIENTSDQTIQVLGQHLYVTPEGGSPMEYIENGVQLQRPIIEPNRGMRYSGFLHVTASPAKVHGEYAFTTAKGVQFKVDVPEFTIEKPKENPEKN